MVFGDKNLDLCCDDKKKMVLTIEKLDLFFYMF